MVFLQEDRTATLDDASFEDGDLRWSLVVAHHYEPRFIGSRIVVGDDGVELGRGGKVFAGDELADEHLSRRHARFELGERGGLQAIDCDSRNGTYLNGARIEMGRVSPGDVIGIGRMLLLAERVGADFEPRQDDELLGSSWPWSRCVSSVDRVAPRDAPVVLWGPSGCGKDLLARRIHARSGCRGEFLVLRCGSFVDNATVSLMGEDGTSPLERARDGTLYLDGIDDAPEALQAALLELLEHGQLRRSDTGQTVPLSLRVVASARSDPQTLSGVRKDFLHRIARWVVAVPPLMRRRSDVAVLVRAFVDRYAGPDARVHPELAFRLLRHNWPGNVREVEAVVERAVVERADDSLVAEFPELDDILIEAREPAAISTMSRGARARQAWVIAASGRWFVNADGDKHNLERRKILARLLQALVVARRDQPGARLTVADLLAAAWPEDRFVGTAGANRVYVALATLRKLGLRDIVVRTDGGYMIAPDAPLQIIDG